jgi:hypothetical protein
MTMPEPQVSTLHPDPYGWRAALRRIVANALLVLLAFEVVSLSAGTAQILVGQTSLSIVELLPLGAVFLLVRWLFVLPGLLLVLVGIEYGARRIPHARLMTAVVAFTPMAWWQLTQASGDTSGQAVVLGITAVVFALIARLPDRFPTSATPPPPEPAVAPR